MQANWNWGIFFEQAPFGNVTYFSWLVDGFLTTVALSVCAWILAFVLGSLFGILRTLPNKILSNIGAAYVTIFRNIPLIVQFFIWYLAAPDLLPYKASVWFKAELNPNIQFFIISVCALGFFTGARVCEQVRSGIQALSHGQRYAALALGLTLPQTYRHEFERQAQSALWHGQRLCRRLLLHHHRQRHRLVIGRGQSGP
jgi:amine acid ABC transporter, permease protein, 3-TM region, His/Glu/Gln/Arg/opine family